MIHPILLILGVEVLCEAIEAIVFDWAVFLPLMHVEVFAMGKESNPAVLQWWTESRLEPHHSTGMEGSTPVQQWWKDSCFESQYSTYSLDEVRDFGHIKMLNWWLQSGLELKWTHWGAQLRKSENNHTAVLQLIDELDVFLL
ncbi:hypothetical protein BJ742DRAFT_775300 [Cladochytrium replicatum]|nr:hypothetical protein BJ742DRAFT_775300 [Cladochytrium replicatum]